MWHRQWVTAAWHLYCMWGASLQAHVNTEITTLSLYIQQFTFEFCSNFLSCPLSWHLWDTRIYSTFTFKGAVIDSKATHVLKKSGCHGPWAVAVVCCTREENTTDIRPTNMTIHEKSDCAIWAELRHTAVPHHDSGISTTMLPHSTGLFSLFNQSSRGSPCH